MVPKSQITCRFEQISLERTFSDFGTLCHDPGECLNHHILSIRIIMQISVQVKSKPVPVTDHQLIIRCGISVQILLIQRVITFFFTVS